ncbi:hypothetical protein GE061_017481 [Apolygus lucorum]|uniref:Uncharacterized protein n=1 Tax=Apolygus lucorum TaxID=248454 RepID=A0A8S9XB56_APOLU|nr:hypothetical protein GE061_017481 [Apolygus lucorum]
MSDFLDDIILIEGKLMDYATRKVFVAPMCVPRVASQRLVLPGTSLWETKSVIQPKILIIPSAEAEMEDIMSNEGLYKYAYQDVSRQRKAEECDTQHSPQSYISRLVQAQRRRRMITQFMDYMPTADGAVEGLPVSSTFIEKGEKRRMVKPGPHPRTRMLATQESIQYTQDIEEQSEVGILKDENEDETSVYENGKRSSRHRSSTRKKSSARKKSSGFSLASDRLSSYYQGFNQRDTGKKAELVVVESSDDEEEQLNNKATQTLVHMRTKRLSTQSPSSHDKETKKAYILN